MSDRDSNDVSNAFLWEGPAIGLLDLDAFFASVEFLDHPEWRGKPLIVGGPPNSRSVVSTASYEARKYGVHSAMPAYRAAQLCPHAIWTRGNYARYSEVSQQVMSVLLAETPYVEQVSIDEAFFDITPARFSNENPITVCKRIQKHVLELGVSASIGLACSKSLAKLASEVEKPKGFTVVLPGSEQAFVEKKKLRELSGIGPAMEASLHELGIHTLGELTRADTELLLKEIGSAAVKMQERAKGEENSPVRARVDTEDAKSISVERTFDKDLRTRASIERAIDALVIKLAERLRKEGLRGSTLTLKIRFDLEHAKTAQAKLAAPSAHENSISSLAKVLLDRIWEENMPGRLLGVGMSDFCEQKMQQLSLINNEDDAHAQLSQTRDEIRKKFGKSALAYGKEILTDKHINERE